ncbi:hypothetical protein BX600DRAFT_429952 [Xylariales sp. PMI_506]|nr:hypothetical protein BX600DRAFT_429952 [Xylariales sp. PMI_506]
MAQHIVTLTPIYRSTFMPVLPKRNIPLCATQGCLGFIITLSKSGIAKKSLRLSIHRAMPRDFFSRSGALELIAQILGSCSSPSDVWALISTCQHTRHVWLSQAPGIIWDVWPRSIPYFHEALIAARVTKIVIDAEAKAELPPNDINLDDLSGESRRPTIDELHTALDLEHLARVYEVCLLRSNARAPRDRKRWPPEVPPEEPERMEEWSARLRFLEGFSVCRIAAVTDDNIAFGHVARWLIKDRLSDQQTVDSKYDFAQRYIRNYGRAACCPNQDNDDADHDGTIQACAVHLVGGDGVREHSDAHLVLWQIMQTVWVGEMIRGYLGGDDQTAFKEFERLSRKVYAVPFGHFRTLEFMIPKHIDSPRVVLPRFSTIHSMPVEVLNQTDADIESILYWIHRHSGQPNYIQESGNIIAPLELKFVVHLLGQYLGVRFHDRSFEEDWEEYNLRFDDYMQHLGIFAHDDIAGRIAGVPGDELLDLDILDGSEILCSSDPPPILVLYDAL